MLYFAVGVEDASMAGAMEAIVRWEELDGASEVSANSAGDGEAFIAFAEDVDFFVGQERGSAIREIGRVADFEGLRGFVEHIGNEESDDCAEADSNA